MENKNPNRVFESIFIISQVLIVIMYGLFTEYGQGTHPATRSTEIKAMTN